MEALTASSGLSKTARHARRTESTSGGPWDWDLFFSWDADAEAEAAAGAERGAVERWPLASLHAAYGRRYLLRRRGLELLFGGGVSGGAAQPTDVQCTMLHQAPPASSRPCLLKLCNASTLTLSQAMRWSCAAPGIAAAAQGTAVGTSALLCNDDSWGACNATCGGGYRNRTLACVNGATLTAPPPRSSTAAPALLKPRALMRCNAAHTAREVLF